MTRQQLNRRSGQAISRELSTSSTLIGSRIIARGLSVAQRRVATATAANCSSVLPKRCMCRTCGIENILGGPQMPNGSSNCPAMLEGPLSRGGMPMRERPDSPCVTSTVSQ